MGCLCKFKIHFGNFVFVNLFVYWRAEISYFFTCDLDPVPNKRHYSGAAFLTVSRPANCWVAGYMYSIQTRCRLGKFVHLILSFPFPWKMKPLKKILFNQAWLVCRVGYFAWRLCTDLGEAPQSVLRAWEKYPAIQTLCSVNKNIIWNLKHFYLPFQ